MTGGTRLFLNASLAFGWGSLEYLNQLDGSRAAIVTDDEAMEKFGFVEQAIQHLKMAGLTTQVVARVAQEPTTETVDIAKPTITDFDPDWIIAIGGGSVLDMAKALWVFCERPDLSWEEAFQFNNLLPFDRVKMIAVPSTSGTGSETSRVAVITETISGMKRLIFSPEIIPTLAILDPNLPAMMPPELTAASAFDSLCHAIESSIATIAHEFTISLALSAIRLIFRHLPTAYHHPDRHAREQIHYGATLAGMAINNSTAGLAHAMDQVGPLFGIPHGIVCAVLMPYTLAFMLDAATDRFADMAQSLGRQGESKKELARAFLDELVSLQRNVNLPLAFNTLGVDESAYMEKLEGMITAAQNSNSTRMSPRIPSPEQVSEIFLQAYEGRLPEVVAA
jgi:alcohol dehydrogenase class IV